MRGWGSTQTSLLMGDGGCENPETEQSCVHFLHKPEGAPHGPQRPYPLEESEARVSCKKS